MNKEDSFYMDTLEKTQPETFDLSIISQNSATVNFPLLLTKSITSSRLSGVPIS